MMPSLPPAPRRLLSITLAVATLSATGCAPSLLDYLNGNKDLTYRAECRKKADKHAGDLANHRYFLPEFHVTAWPGEMPKGRKIGEKQFIEHLLSGRSRFAMVIARGGLGKTRLAMSIQAQTCATVPLISIDLNKDVAQQDVQGTDAMLLMRLAGKLGVTGGPSGLAELDRLLRSQPWFLLADAIEEVELLKRPKVALALAKLRARYPSTMRMVIFARPPLLIPYYGFSQLDTVVQILPISCKRARKFVGVLSRTRAEEAAFWAFANKYGFDVKGRFGYGCIYPYMATYRDVIVLRRLALSAGRGTAVESYADAHEHLMAERLRKELKTLGWSRREALDMVDRMVRFHAEGAGPSKLVITLADCMKSIDADYGWTAVDAGVEGNSEQRRRQVCEKALQSVVFRQIGEEIGDDGKWGFFDPVAEELFIARWLNGELARAAAGDCTAIDRHMDLLGSGAVVRFLVGQRLVQRCFPRVIRALCSRSQGVAAHIDDVIKGLPTGQKRQLLVEEARAWEADKGEDRCAMASLDTINKSIGAP